MALDKEIEGKSILLGFDLQTPITAEGNTVTTENVRLVGCLTDNGIDISTASQGTTTKCSGNFQTSTAGASTWTINGSGVNIEVPELDDRISSNELFKLAKDRATFWAFQYNVEEEQVRYGVVRLDSYSEANPAEGSATFTLTLTGIGEVYDQDDLATTT